MEYVMVRINPTKPVHVYWFFVSLSLILFCSSVEAASCKLGDIMIGEDSHNIYCARVVNNIEEIEAVVKTNNDISQPEGICARTETECSDICVREEEVCD